MESLKITHLELPEFEKLVRDRDYKYEYSFVAVTFALLAISVQAFPGGGTKLIPVLIVGWVSLLASASIGGYRIRQAGTFMRLCLQVIKLEYDSSNADAEKREDLKKKLAEKDKKRKDIREKIESLRPKQEWIFLLGIALNALFIFVNKIPGLF